MKKLIPLILAAAMTLTLTACTAAPDPAPLATPTPEPTAARFPRRCRTAASTLTMFPSNTI